MCLFHSNDSHPHPNTNTNTNTNTDTNATTTASTTTPLLTTATYYHRYFVDMQHSDGFQAAIVNWLQVRFDRMKLPNFLVSRIMVRDES